MSNILQERFVNRIVFGKCTDLLKLIPDESVDVVFADPPFNLKKKYHSYRDSLALQDYLVWCEEWIAECVRITKPTGSIFLHNIPKWLTYYAAILNKNADFRHWISWNAPTAPMGKTLQPNHYGILFYAKNARLNKCYEIRSPHVRCRKCKGLHKDYGGKKHLLHPFGALLSDVWSDIHRLRHRKHRDDHPCQLPLALMERIVLMSTDEGDIVLDPFSGTGTTAIAAKRLGRSFIGLEMDEFYAANSEEKLAQYEPLPGIGGAQVSLLNDKIITLRDKDWTAIAPFYSIPADLKLLDGCGIALNK